MTNTICNQYSTRHRPTR